ncbi:MAG: type III effector HopL1 [Desulfovibrio sp.]|nr:MAG: type III effector HopL1 [Desulfovibrio sp.]
MFKEDKELASRCNDLAQVALGAVDWVGRNRDVVRNESDSLATQLRKSARFFRKCARAAERKMCVGVFGPSQAGKSYLISALAQGADGRLLADFDGEVQDFIKEINPEGGKESTGLVTRFTLTPPDSLPSGYPVQLRLLSEMDIVKILANTYYSDFLHEEPPDVKAMAAAVRELRHRKQPSRTGLLDQDDMEDLRDYVSKNFRTSPRVQALEKVFWPRAVEIAPYLSPSDRAKLFSQLWDGADQFTDLYRRLYAALESLGFAEQAYCPLSALIPREDSIIDVATLSGLGAGHGADLMLATAQGKTITLPKSEVTALTAELTIVMVDKPDDFFDHTDMLDFPGYRSRLQIADIREELQKGGMLENFFLRGKVAYLFERYCEERELTSMLLCIGPGNQEVQTLPAVIDEWVRASHGQTPETRTGKPISLYFVLTKFDMEFQEKKGATESDESRWTTRLQASLLDFFGKQHEWPVNWDITGAFKNLFWLRNPNVKAKEIFTYDGEVEVGPRQDQAEYVERLRGGYLANPEVERHFADPEKAWQAAMTVNDGGVTYLREQLRPLCNPELKRSQIRSNVKEYAERLSSRLAQYFRSDDKEEERRKKAELAKKLSAILARCIESQRFGELLGELQLADHDLYDLYFHSDGDETGNGGEEASQPDLPGLSEAGIGETVSAEDLLSDVFGAGTTVESSLGASGGNGSKATDEAGRNAQAIERYWVGRMRTVADSGHLQKFFDFPPEYFSQFVHELALGANRLSLTESMAERMRQASRFRSLTRDKLAWKQVSQAVTMVNNYIDYLGHNPREVEEHEREVHVGGKQLQVFANRPQIQGWPVIGEDQSAYEAGYYRDWLLAFVFLVQENVEGDEGFNHQENTRLGEIIREFAGAA